MRFDVTHKGYGIRIRKSDRLYALIFARDIRAR